MAVGDEQCLDSLKEAIHVDGNFICKFLLILLKIPQQVTRYFLNALVKNELTKFNLFFYIFKYLNNSLKQVYLCCFAWFSTLHIFVNQFN